MSKYNFWLDASKLTLLQAHLRGEIQTRESIQLEKATDKAVSEFLNQLDTYRGNSQRLNVDFVGDTLSAFWKRLTYSEVYLHSLQNLIKTIYENKVKDELDRLNMTVTWHGSPDESSIDHKTSRFCSTHNEPEMSNSFHCPIEDYVHNQACKKLVEKLLSFMEDDYQVVARARLQGIPMKDLAQQRGLPPNRLSVYLSREYAKIRPLFKHEYERLFCE